jgi:organic hydroperoxide reductase OsmC/OhrA
MTEVILKPTINILKEEDREKTEKIILKAEKACLISNSITSKVTLESNVLVG